MNPSADAAMISRGVASSTASLVGSGYTLKLWKGSYDELHNEPEQGQVLAHILDWIDEHITA